MSSSLPPAHDAKPTQSQQLYNGAALMSPSIPMTPDGETGVLYSGIMAPGGPAEIHPTNDVASLLDASAPFPLPFPTQQPLPTPLFEDYQPQIDLSLGLSGTNAPIPSSTVIRTAHNLRLPSFDVLGIAAPHPDRLPLRTENSFFLGTGPLSKPEDPLHVLSPPLQFHHQTETSVEPPATSPRLTKPHLDQQVAIFTPPSESGTFTWGSFVNVRMVGIGSPPSSEPGVSPNLNVTPSAATPGQATIIVPTYAELSDAVGMAAWISELKNTLITESKCLDLDSVKVLSHALPCPSLRGHLFGQIIAAIHERTATRTSWINVFHAVPGRYTLSDLPKSPPSTPGPTVGGDSYFTSKVFDSAVAIPDYQLDSKLLPPSPQPVVPPGSINISVVERYIPPTNTNEAAEMFSLRGHSLLYDRLVEVSSDHGMLLFIYPTRTGARTFMQHHLSPILDPLLRTLAVVNNLPSNFGKQLGGMAAVDYLLEFELLNASIRSFCNGLSARSESSGSFVYYQLIHAAKEEVILDRSAWADDWWIKQEKSRIREVVTIYAREAKKLHLDEITSTHLVQEIFSGVSKREYQNQGPRKGVEVGVFMIKKTRVEKND